MRNDKFAILVVWVLSVMMVAAGIAGCATPKISPKDLSYSALQLADETLVIGGIEGALLSRDGIMKGGYCGYQVNMSPLYPELISLGYQDSDITTGSIALIAHSLYWNNVLTEPHGEHGLKWAIVPKGLKVSGADIVEIKIKNGIGYIVSVRYKHEQAETICKFEKFEKNPVSKKIDALNLYGGGGSASLICQGLEADGWEKKNNGAYGEFIWVKKPNK